MLVTPLKIFSKFLIPRIKENITPIGTIKGLEEGKMTSMDLVLMMKLLIKKMK